MKMIDSYLLSSTQKEKLNSILQISAVEDQIVILVQKGKIIGSIRGINKKNEYLNELKSYKFIEQIENYINNIDYDEFENLISTQEKSIILVGKDNCKYCDEVIEILNVIIIDYDIKINYLNIKDFATDVMEKLFTKSSTQIAMFHTFFNTITTILLLPFAKYMVKAANLLVKEKDKKY